MRLINTSTLRLEDFRSTSRLPDYAILSHRWRAAFEEVTFHDFLDGTKRDTAGWAKIVDFCKVALADDLKYCWIDTCCINKESSAEETRSINSMFAWYAGAKKAVVYLEDVHCEEVSVEGSDEQSTFASSEWFTRGWTLQELIAPREVVFYNSGWIPLGSKSSLCGMLSEITSIPAEVLRGERSHLSCSVAQRMYWAANRETTVVEDQAYSLLGIFDVNLPLIYGEGSKAFMRLQEEIMQRSTDQTIFAWSDERLVKGVLAPSLNSFYTSISKEALEVSDYFPDDPASNSFRLGNAGLSIDFVLIPWSMNTYLAPLKCYAASEGSDPGQRVCLILRRTPVASRFVRICFNDADLVLHRYLRVPSDPNPSYWDRSRLHRHVVIAREPNHSLSKHFYGFQLNFWCPSLFESGSKADAKDVVAEQAWDRNSVRLEITHGTFRVAGIFRLNKKRFNASFMFLGFDADFNPFCMIASSPFQLMKTYLPLVNVKRDIIDAKDLSKMSAWERSSWLDTMYLHKYIDEILRISKESPFDWQATAISHGLLLGDRNTLEEVFEVPNFRLMVIFKLIVSSEGGTYWRITFKDLPNPGALYYVLDSQSEVGRSLRP